MIKKIMIDPGHYAGFNRSPVVPEYTEGDRVWKLSQYLGAALKKRGFIVGYTKTTINGHPKNAKGGDDVYKRGTKSKGYDLLLSLHSNACDTESVDRAVVIPPVSGKEKALATKLGAVVKKIMGLSSYQIYTRDNGSGRDYYGVIRGAAYVGTPCLIIEHGFHTNAAVAKWLLVDSNLQKLADAEADAIADYYGVTVTEKPVTAPEIYRVRKSWADAKSQLGAFKSLENAKAKADAVSGYNVYNSAGKCVYSPGSSKKTVDEIAREVIAGKWGVGEERRKALTAAGYDYTAVQCKVNALLD